MENLSKQIDVLITVMKEREPNFKSFVMEFHMSIEKYGSLNLMKS